jgi:hypothetical protein
MPNHPERKDNRQESRPLFELGQVVATPGALAALDATGEDPLTFLHRHITGDWSEMDPHDQRENQLSVQEGHRVFSSYTLADGRKLWVITEWNRSVTTLLLPLEY